MDKRISRYNANVIFIDNDDDYIKKVLERFQKSKNYKLLTFSKSEDFFNFFFKLKSSPKKILIVFISNSIDNEDDITAIEVLEKIKKRNENSEVILYSDNDDIDTMSLAYKYGAYAIIKKNENILLRIENNIKGIISQKNFLLRKKSSKFYTRVFLGFILFVFFVTLIFYFIFPEWFFV